MRKMVFFVKSSGEKPVCPFCRTELIYRDSRKRIYKQEGGTKEHIRIRRLKCPTCECLHNELPDVLVPYKHYAAEVICGVIDEVITGDDLDSEDYPCFLTMYRWVCWLRINLERIEGYLRNAAFTLLMPGSDILNADSRLLDLLREKYSNWLERMLRIIYNSGGFLVPYRGKGLHLL